MKCPANSRNARVKDRKHRRALEALAAGAAIAAGTQAYAAPVRFDNPLPGQPYHFSWGTGTHYTTALYIHLPPEQQGTAMYFNYYSLPIRGPRSVNRTAEWFYYGSWNPAFVMAGWFHPTFLPSADLQTDSASSYGFAWGFAPGETIPHPSAFWNMGYYGGSMGKVRDPASGFSRIPESVPAYLGVRISNLAGGPGWHYGWIGVRRTGGSLSAFAWGYETSLGTPIAAGIPEPGTLALLAFGAAAAVGRRRG